MGSSLIYSKFIMAAFEGVELTSQERTYLEIKRPVGVTLFKRNIPEDFSLLPSTLSVIRKTLNLNHAPIFAIDQEGGRVSRIGRPFPDQGPPLKLVDEEKISPTFFKNYGFSVATNLKALGINVNFAPVLDILTQPKNKSIGDRCFGRTPEQVIANAGAYLEGQKLGKIISCLKHFPGQGHAEFDTHTHTAIISKSMEDLLKCELAPFVKLLPQCQAAMVSHAIYPSIDEKVASRSPKIIQELLRKELKYDGLLFSDDLNMYAAINDMNDFKECIVETFMAGCDVLLVCRHLDLFYKAHEALEKAHAKYKSVEQRVEESYQRVTQFCSLFS